MLSDSIRPDKLAFNPRRIQTETLPVRPVHPDVVITDKTPLDAPGFRATAQPRFTSRLVIGFGAPALVLAARVDPVAALRSE